jgi:AAA+ ATPase superfamily predicted ATPase
MTKIIGRIQEQKTLEEAYASKEAEFIAVYGRRRIGKTYLIKNFFQTKKCFFFQTVGIYKGDITKQLTQFMRALGHTFYQGAAMQIPLTWMDAFEALTLAIKQTAKGKIILFFDELPWINTHKSGLIQALEFYWNRHWCDDNRIKLVACGSAASWIIQKIIKNRGGLHNRITRKMNLLPFNLQDTDLYLRYLGYACDHNQVIKLYMVTGGVPFYLKQFKNNQSIDQNINQLFFTPTGILFDEFDELFASLFQHAEQYKEIITLIAHHKEGVPRTFLDEKNKMTGQGGRLTKRLANLEYAGFISSYILFGHTKRGIYYRLTDEYCYFYFKWIEPIKSRLKQDPSAHHWENCIREPKYFSWMGYTFENICYKHLLQIKMALGILSSFASPWRYSSKKGSGESGAQIDLLFDRNDNAITLCEIKYSEKPFIIDKEYAGKLVQKINVFKQITHTKKQIFISLITARGLKKTLYSEELVQGVVKLEDFFK